MAASCVNAVARCVAVRRCARISASYLAAGMAAARGNNINLANRWQQII